MILKTTLVTIALVVLTSCASTSKQKTIQYNIDRAKNISHIERSFQLYTKYKTHKAMAVAIDNEGRYVIGYSYDCGSDESAKNIALNNCTRANNNTKFSADTSCVIYAVADKVIYKIN